MWHSRRNYISEGGEDYITPLLYGPLDTSRIPMQTYFCEPGPMISETLSDCVTLTFQVPLNADMPTGRYHTLPVGIHDLDIC